MAVSTSSAFLNVYTPWGEYFFEQFYSFVRSSLELRFTSFGSHKIALFSVQ